MECDYRNILLLKSWGLDRILKRQLYMNRLTSSSCLHLAFLPSSYALSWFIHFTRTFGISHGHLALIHRVTYHIWHWSTVSPITFLFPRSHDPEIDYLHRVNVMRCWKGSTVTHHIHTLAPYWFHQHTLVPSVFVRVISLILFGIDCSSWDSLGHFFIVHCDLPSVISPLIAHCHDVW